MDESAIVNSKVVTSRPILALFVMPGGDGGVDKIMIIIIIIVVMI